MVVFHKTSGNPQQIWHKEALQHDKPGSERALVQRRFMGNKALPEENFMQQEAIFSCPWGGLGTSRAYRESRERGRRKLPFMAFFLPRWCGSLFTAVLGYDACKSGKNLFKRSWKRGKEQTETCPILMEQAPLQTRFGNDALLLGEKNCFFPKSQRLAEVIGENAQGAGKRLPGC